MTKVISVQLWKDFGFKLKTKSLIPYPVSLILYALSYISYLFPLVPYLLSLIPLLWVVVSREGLVFIYGPKL